MSMNNPKVINPRKPVIQQVEPWLYLLPFLLGVVFFTLFPVINVVFASFKEGYRYPALVATGIGIILVITIYNALRIRFTPTIACLIVVTLCTNEGM